MVRSGTKDSKVYYGNIQAIGEEVTSKLSKKDEWIQQSEKMGVYTQRKLHLSV